MHETGFEFADFKVEADSHSEDSCFLAPFYTDLLHLLPSTPAIHLIQAIPKSSSLLSPLPSLPCPGLESNSRFPSTLPLITSNQQQ